jgi:zinc transport system substrate-binding protein
MLRPFRLLALMVAIAIAPVAILVMARPAYALDGVVASIKPVHSLVAAVMEGEGEPALIVRGAGSGHAHTLRPSDAEALERARIVFRIGPGMETFLNAPLATLAAGAEVVSLADAPGVVTLPLRAGGEFETHAHEDDDDDDDHDHDHHAPDLHVWLDPVNAQAMVAAIAQALGEVDPANAARYAANANAYSARIDALVGELRATVEPVRSRPAIVFHDAYRYFEARFGLDVAGSITVSPEVAPGAQRLSEIRDKVRELGATCVFSEPQFEPRLVSVVTEGSDARTGVLDPLGADIPDGPELYLDLMRNLARSFAACLSRPG